jgi:hypothetical protein
VPTQHSRKMLKNQFVNDFASHQMNGDPCLF